MKYLAILVVAVSMFTSSTAISGPTDVLKKGFIANDSGEKCWYIQEVKTENKYFHGETTGTHGVITFDDNQCMRDSGIGLETNMMMINNIISKWYSHDDAKFKTRVSDLFLGSLLQKNGKCIQSTTYPMIGIVVDYFIENGSIVGAIHGSSVQGCTN